MDLVVFIVIFLLASKSRLYFSWFPESSYTSLGHVSKSKSYATWKKIKFYQSLMLHRGADGLTTAAFV